MTEIEFRERSYEGPLLHELQLGSSPSLYQPDQVLEATLGFDAALHTLNAVFWQTFGVPARAGSPICPLWWRWPLRPPPLLPVRLVNAFIQLKCPHVLTQRNAKEWSRWNSPYFRFWITPHQQSALEACVRGVGSLGVVVYAAPAFSTLADLVAFQDAHTLIANSHFTEALLLSGHERYTYATAGTNGWACSEPTEVPAFNWAEGFVRLLRLPEIARPELVFKVAAKALLLALRASPSGERLLPKIRERSEQVAALLVGATPDSTPVVRDFAFAALASELLELAWLIGGG